MVHSTEEKSFHEKLQLQVKLLENSSLFQCSQNSLFSSCSGQKLPLLSAADVLYPTLIAFSVITVNANLQGIFPCSKCKVTDSAHRIIQIGRGVWNHPVQTYSKQLCIRGTKTQAGKLKTLAARSPDEHYELRKPPWRMEANQYLHNFYLSHLLSATLLLKHQSLVYYLISFEYKTRN